ncbi:MAG: hypothetical protein RR945_03215 [Erysipelotrichaceae bacterium]
MKKRLVMILTLTFAIFVMSNASGIKAMENNPAFFVADEYVIIEHSKYDLVNNKIIYNGLEYELIDSGVFEAYDDEGILNILSLPIEDNRITDKERIKELNEQVGISSDGNRSLPSSTVNAPYTRTLPNNQWSVTTPAVNINIPGQTYYRVLSLKVTGLAWNASKKFSVHGIWGDIAGDWYDLPKFLNHDFGLNNTVKWQNFSTTRYAILTFGSLAGETGYTYTINKSTF